ACGADTSLPSGATHLRSHTAGLGLSNELNETVGGRERPEPAGGRCPKRGSALPRAVGTGDSGRRLRSGASHARRGRRRSRRFARGFGPRGSGSMMNDSSSERLVLAARALRAGDPIAALNYLTGFAGAHAIALRGIALAQLNEFHEARKLLKQAR